VHPWTFEASEEAVAYLDQIRAEMLLLFDITDEEAVGRINRHFAGQSITSDVKVGVLLHEEQDAWARHIYFGRDSFWWIHDPAELDPLPWP
jgi:hypothetical protein